MVVSSAQVTAMGLNECTIIYFYDIVLCICLFDVLSKQKKSCQEDFQGKTPNLLMYCFCQSKHRLLRQADSLVGANRSASTALCALIGVDVVDFAFRDSAHGALVDACAASNTVISNYVCHNDINIRSK
jgi:hypothetical protein